MTAPTRPRIDYLRLEAGKDAMFALTRSVNTGPLDRRTVELVRIRISQLNGCAFCLDLHVRDAREAGETEQRLSVLAGWHEAPFFTERERAALAFAEAVTLLAGRGVPDEVIDAVEEHFSSDEVAALLYTVAEINAWNRFAVAARTPIRERRD